MQPDQAVNSPGNSGTSAPQAANFQCLCCRRWTFDQVRTFRKAPLCRPCYITVSYVIKDQPRVRQALDLLKTREMRNA